MILVYLSLFKDLDLHIELDYHKEAFIVDLCLRKQNSVDSLEIDISAEKADQAVEDVALGDICNEDRDVISFHE